MEEILLNFSKTHEIISYLIVFFSIFIEGAIITLIAGVLSAKDYLNINYVILAAFLASVLHDLLFWYLGKNILHLKKTRFLVNIEKTEKLIKKLKIHNGFFISISKFSWGFNRIVLAAAGIMKTPIRKLLSYSIPSCLLWSIIIAYLGNIFSSKIDILGKGLKTAGLFTILLIAIFIVLENIIRKFFEKRYYKNNNDSLNT